VSLLFGAINSISSIQFISAYCHIYRHPKGQHEQWAEDARNRIQHQTGADIEVKV
jgi:hypothetical protein